MSSDISDDPKTRVRVVFLAMIVCFIFLGTTLWRVQLVRGSEFRQSMDRQSQRRIRLPGIRGRIVDRNGICL
ncbi:MAG: hypothetical protein JXN60_02515, partial [Lentisphaerae bacterium]|nr:hypothetical protein [Lentisphaerota bacterium]